MASDRGLASAQEHSSSEQKLHAHSQCQNHPEHELFLSHSGKQKPFVHDLFKEFLNVPRFQSNEPFFDTQDASLPKGEEFVDRIIKAARNCKVAVIILTGDYLTSKWPMLELLHFIDAKRTTNPDMKLVPVFYEVDLFPSHLGDQAIEDHWKVEWENIIDTGSSAKPRKISLTVESCKQALRILKNINGIEAWKFQSLESLRNGIVSVVLKYLPSSFDPEMDPDVEGCLRLCDMISGMFQEYDKGMQCLGLYGMGGSGKTTMCKALCSYFGPSFNHRVYHLQIGHNDCGKSQENLFERHKELLRELIFLSQEEVDRIRDPRKVLKMRLKTQPVFLAVDDVREDSESSQEVRAYLSYLCSGSKIIITARSRNIVEGVIDRPNYCKPIPNLEEKEALSLFLKIVAPERNLTSLNGNETRVLGACLQICFFSLEEGVNQNLFPLDADGDPYVPTAVGHYHPLALRAVASYFKDQYSELGSIVERGLELLNKKKLLFSSNVSNRTFDVLGFGFHEICQLGKQLFIDVALYAPRRSDDGEDIFNWLVDIHVNLNPEVIHSKLEHLRKMSFLNFDGKPGHSACMNISMHDLYREYAKRFVNEHKKEDSYKCGVYYDRYYQAPSVLASSGWAKASRIRLKRWKDVIKVKDWCCVSVIHLIYCETITTFSIGRELVNLRDLKICDCSKLEALHWTRDIISERLQGVKLCFVKLSFNKSLKILPDFSNCSELRELSVTECSSSVEPLHLHTCSSLRLLHIAGENAPEVRTLQSCLKLKSVQLAWKVSHKGLLLSNLPSLSALVIVGSSVLPTDSSHEFIMPHGHNLFCQHYPNDTVCYELTGVWELINLRTLHLNHMPLGCLPKGLSTIGSSLEDLNLRGCLLSQLVDFSAFPNLQYLSLAQTNVKELRGLGSLKKLIHLDCRFNFRLQRIPDLRPSARLEYVSLDQCPELQAIPRLPPRCCKNPPGSEDFHRLHLAFAAFVNTTKSAIPPPLFALFRDRILAPSTTTDLFTTEVNIKLSHLSLSRVVPNPIPHLSVMCDGCMMQPLIGPRYKARDIRTTYDLCTKCFTNKCDRSDCNFTKSSSPGTYRCINDIEMNYDLCYACFRESGCDERDFYPGVLLTIR